MSATRRQPFSFSLADSLLAEVAGIPQRLLHFDVDAICRAYEAIKPVASRLGIAPPAPRLAGFAYPHLAALGATIRFTDFEPNVVPLLRSAEEIDHLREPDDYLAADLIRERLRLLGELKKRHPNAGNWIGHEMEGPVTTAALLLGQEFFTLPYLDPERAHRLLGFCVKSALNYAAAITEHFGGTIQPGPKWIPDDFAGMFPAPVFREFVAPYWNAVYEGLKATRRGVHSELLRVEHLPFLQELHIEEFDPGADQYLTPELLRAHCPVRFQCTIESWHIRELTCKELQAMYRRLASTEPFLISFSMDRLVDEPKVVALLQVARELAGQSG